MGHANDSAVKAGSEVKRPSKVMEVAAGENALNAKVTPLTSTRIRISPVIPLANAALARWTAPPASVRL